MRSKVLGVKGGILTEFMDYGTQEECYECCSILVNSHRGD
jgi:hypothetical protein